jgi:hypothetical protein
MFSDSGLMRREEKRGMKGKRRYGCRDAVKVRGVKVLRR